MKTLVVYYSQNGSNGYLAGKISRSLNADIEELKPRLGGFFFLILSTLTKISFGNKPLVRAVADYNRIVLCGPIYMGSLASPVRDFINTYGKSVNTLAFVTCCGSLDETKDDKFGYASVFTAVKNMLGEKCVLCEAFPIGLVVPDDKKNDDEAMMKTRFSDENFTARAQERFDAFIKKLNG